MQGIKCRAAQRQGQRRRRRRSITKHALTWALHQHDHKQPFMWKQRADRPQALVFLLPSRGPDALTRWLGLEASTRALIHARANNRACVAPNARIRAVESGRGSRGFREARCLIKRLKRFVEVAVMQRTGLPPALAPAARPAVRVMQDAPCCGGAACCPGLQPEPAALPAL